MSGHPGVEALAKLARELGIVMLASVFERDGPHYYNSIAKSHSTPTAACSVLSK